MSWRSGPDWRSTTSYVGVSTSSRETAEERDIRWRREQEEAEARQLELQMQRPLVSSAAPAMDMDDLLIAQMAAERARLEEKLKKHEERSKAEWQAGMAAGHREDEARMREMAARNDKELAMMQEQLQAMTMSERQVASDLERQRHDLAASEQQTNPLGLHHSSITPTAPPVYSEDAKFNHKLLGTNPTLHSASELFETKQLSMNEYTAQSSDMANCTSCFNPITSGQAVRAGHATYHMDCYVRKGAPKCSSCGETVYAKSGQWGEYNGKRYHVECYQFRAGPRCCSCFNIIFANPEHGFSGQWRMLDDASLIHEECFRRRLADQQQDKAADDGYTKAPAPPQTDAASTPAPPPYNP
eukprot:m.10478 g.10478  ORF g.10478 m.10478 type:complete len:357 (+) comp5572_c0_seq1:200-1270(+)